MAQSTHADVRTGHDRASGPPLGFTLVEILVVVVIIGMLVGLMMPAVLSARARARQTECSNNQRNVAQAILQYENAKQRFPGYVNAYTALADPNVAWVVPIMEYLGRADLMRTWRSDPDDDGDGLPDGGQVRVDLLVCPSDQGSGTCPLSYVANCGRPGNDATLPASGAPAQATGIFHDRSGAAVSARSAPTVTLTDLRDGGQHTLLIAERLHEEADRMLPATIALPTPLGQWTNWNEQSVGFVWDIAATREELPQRKIAKGLPLAAADDAKTHPGLTSNHSGGVNISFCDGHQHFLSEDVDYVVFQLLASPDSRAARVEAASEPGGGDWNCKGQLSDEDF